ncbi:YlmC/YmxH family sporulation protein [Ureibacillus aquaedulcis]|uniref:YlmC/YmxH family sporulation protein n=1 Tax=Ureibacillus aquaedulcis TaxID=3058421 RepID=A0ABT8GSC4_9BACL|nr:YlmC/YmxH family sporulation protein [Ureibacillus sp. BA0131]MDN4494298.1 YlmC/YmxH family sporulation protein [Ureibacillus sp. BA0131]
MLLSELAEKELIEMENGVRYGYLAETECLFDPKTGKIFGFELHEQSSKMPFQKKKATTPLFIPWEEIHLIGEDRILFHRTSSKRRQFD